MTNGARVVTVKKSIALSISILVLAAGMVLCALPDVVQSAEVAIVGATTTAAEVATPGVVATAVEVVPPAVEPEIAPAAEVVTVPEVITAAEVATAVNVATVILEDFSDM